MIKKYIGVIFFVLICIGLHPEGSTAETKADCGGSVRLRHECWENMLDFGTLNMPDRDFLRLRTILWEKVDFTRDVGFYISLTNEARYYWGKYKPFEIEAPSVGYQTSNSSRFDEDELVISNLHFTVNNVFGLPLDIRIGRQDFVGSTGYGDGFVILEGTPGDGSRTAYFNAFKAVWRIAENTSLDLIYLNDPQKDDFLPSLYPAISDYLKNYADNKRLLNISDEKGFVAYLRTKSDEDLTFEPYYIYKREDGVGPDYTQGPGPKDRLDIHTFGARAVYKIADWTIKGEFAHQEGEYDSIGPDRDRKGNGGYLFVGWKFPEVVMKPELGLGFVYLSGDDPNTKDHEGWDPVFSRGPSWSSICGYILVSETMGDGGAITYYWTNLHLFKADVKLALTSGTNLVLSYQYLRADEKTNMTGSVAPMFSNDSKDRGHIGTLKLTHAFNERLAGYLQIDYFVPGDFYSDKADDAAFLVLELEFKF